MASYILFQLRADPGIPKGAWCADLMFWRPFWPGNLPFLGENTTTFDENEGGGEYLLPQDPPTDYLKLISFNIIFKSMGGNMMMNR